MRRIKTVDVSDVLRSFGFLYWISTRNIIYAIMLFCIALFSLSLSFWLSRILLAVPSERKSFYEIWIIFRSRIKNSSAVQILLLLIIILNKSKEWKGECLNDWHRINHKRKYQKICFIVSYEKEKNKRKKLNVCVRNTEMESSK